MQAQEGKLAPQIHVDYDWEAPQEFSYDSEDEPDEKVMGRQLGMLISRLQAMPVPSSSLSPYPE